MENSVLDRYVLGQVLGTGGMGRVVRAHDTRLDRPVAIKFLRDDADALTRARMETEARLAGSLHHPGIAQVFDYAEDTSDGTSRPFIVMQLVEGTNLAELLRSEGALAPATVARLIADVADALAVAHASGVVHRDLKPANIVITPAGRPVLVDFGIARSVDGEPLTETGVMVGTADYISPEQARGRAATAASDLYSLGVVAHHCLSGRSPFRRETSVATALAHLHEAPPALGVDPALVELVEDLLAKSPEDRPASATQVAQRAGALTGLAETPVVLPPVDADPLTGAATGAMTGAMTGAVTGPSAASPAHPPTGTMALPLASPAGTAGRRPRRGLLVGLVSALVALAAIFAGGAVLSGDPEVPDVVGLDLATAERLLDQRGFIAKIERVDEPGVPADEVVAQDPLPATATDRSRVTLEVSTGKVTVSTQDLVGKPYAEAAAALEELGLTVVRDDRVSAKTAGTVIALDRSGRVEVGTSITLIVARAAVGTSTPAKTNPAPTSADRTPAKKTGPPSNKGKGNNNGNGNGKGKKGKD